MDPAILERSGKGHDRVEDPDEQARIVQSDAYLADAYHAMYEAMLAADRRKLTGAGHRVEIGSAGGFLRSLVPSLITTDVRVAHDVDVGANAERLPFRDSSVRTIFSKDCLHHIPDVEAFFAEALRVCAPGGGVVCIEPYWSPVARGVYRWIHPEDFDTKAKRWRFTSDHPLAANQALLYLLLRRDRDRFDRLFSEFEVIELGPMVGPSYLLSGGVSRRGMLPASMLRRLGRLESNSTWWRRAAALSILVVFRRRGGR